MSLEDWQKFGWLKAHKTNRTRSQNFWPSPIVIGSVEDPGLHNDWGFNIAYNAALQIATAALAARGYQAERATTIPCDRLIEPDVGHRCGKH